MKKITPEVKKIIDSMKDNDHFTEEEKWVYAGSYVTGLPTRVAREKYTDEELIEIAHEGNLVMWKLKREA